MKMEESSRLSPEASNTEVSDGRRIDGKVDRKKRGPREFRMVFPVVMYGCESWTVKKAEC